MFETNSILFHVVTMLRQWYDQVWAQKLLGWGSEKKISVPVPTNMIYSGMPDTSASPRGPVRPAVLYIILLITNTKNSWWIVRWNSSPPTSLLKLTWPCCDLSVFSSCRSSFILSTSLSSKTLCRFTSPSSLLSSLFLFLTGDDSSAFCQDSKSPYFSKILKFNVKLIHTSGLGVCFFFQYEAD